jgi:hypothetical protein
MDEHETAENTHDATDASHEGHGYPGLLNIINQPDQLPPDRFTEELLLAEPLTAEQKELIKQRVRVRLVFGRHGATADTTLNRDSYTAEQDFTRVADVIDGLDPSQGDVVGVEDLRYPRAKRIAVGPGAVEPFSTEIRTMDELADARTNHKVDAFTYAGVRATLRGVPTFFTDASPAELAERRRNLGFLGRLREAVAMVPATVHDGDYPLREQLASERAVTLALYMATHPVPSATRPATLTIFYGDGHSDTVPPRMQGLGVEPEIVS